MFKFIKNIKSLPDRKVFRAGNRGMTHSMFTQGHPEYSRGMTYVELIVVLSIFSIMSSIVVFNYGKFQAKVDIKNLANDIALKFVEAQKSSISGRLQTSAISGWKPSYGIYFNVAANPPNTGNSIFYYFTDLDQDKTFDYGAYSCPNSECVEKFNLTKGNTISEVRVYYTNNTSEVIPGELHLTFTRPDFSMMLRSTTAFAFPVSYIEITIISPKGNSAKIKVYTSGRIQIN